MRKNLYLSLVLLLLILFFSSYSYSLPRIQSTGSSFGVWTRDVDAAVNLASQNGTFVVLYLGMSSCTRCSSAMSNVFNTPTFYDWSVENKIPLVFSDYDTDKSFSSLRKKYASTSNNSVPKIVFINGATDTTLKIIIFTRSNGYRTMEDFLRAVDSLGLAEAIAENKCIPTPEICNGFDDDCDGEIDEGLTFYDFYQDNDGDGFGAGEPTRDCDYPSGLYSLNNLDCDDSDSSVYPGAFEICDGKDNDCDGEVDEGFDCVKGTENCPVDCMYGTRRINKCKGSIPLNSIINTDGLYKEKQIGSTWYTVYNDTYFYKKESRMDCTYSCKENYFYRDGNCHPYSCIPIDMNYLNATMCPDDNIGVVGIVYDKLEEECTDERKCQYTCNEGYYFGIISSTGKRACLPQWYNCIGDRDGNSVIYKGDDEDLTQDTDRVLSIVNTSRKCEYRCIKNFILNEDGNKCIPNPYKCTQSELIDSNAIIFEEDNVDLAEDTISVLVESDANTSRKCEYYCKPGFHKGVGLDENKCLPNNYFCEGDIDSNAIPCVDWNVGLDQNTTNKLVSRCTSKEKCAWVCPYEFERGGGEDSNKCVPKPVYECTGPMDTSSAQIIEGDDENLSLFDNLINTLVFENTPMKCEWVCKEGYQLVEAQGVGYKCVEKSKDAFQCVGRIDSNAIMYENDDVDLTQDTNRVLSTSNTQRKCEYHCRAGYYLSVVQGEAMCLPMNYNCIGTIPNGVIYIGDDFGLTQDLNVVLVEKNTNRKCEYHCALNYKKDGNVCVPLSISTAVCGNAERGYTPDESFPSTFTLCERGTPSITNPSLNQEIGSITSWTCIDDINKECYATRVSSKYVAPPQEEKTTNSIITATPKMSEGGKIKLILKCEKTTAVEVTVKDYLSKEEYKLNQKTIDCPVDEKEFVLELVSTPIKEKTLDIKVALVDKKDCEDCELTRYMDYIPSEDTGENNLFGFIILGVMIIILLIGVGAYFFLNKNKTNNPEKIDDHPEN